jgi:hypothetical protein
MTLLVEEAEYAVLDPSWRTSRQKRLLEGEFKATFTRP